MIGCLKTKAFLTQRNVPCVTICALCGATLESDEHLFLQCLYSLDVWSVLFQKLCLTPQPCNSPIEMIESILSRVNQNDKAMITLGKLIFPAVDWNVWQERNSCIFRGKNMDWRYVAYRTQAQIWSRILFLGLHLRDHVSCHWDLPPSRIKQVRNVVHAPSNMWRLTIAWLAPMIMGVLLS